jgi:predicted methyltransferase
MADDETYDPARIAALEAALRELARRILALDAAGRLLEETPELLKALGDMRSELFTYEVRKTFDTPEVAEHRRIVEDASAAWAPEDHPEEGEDDAWP